MIECRLKELMELKGVTQTDISNATGITRPTLLSLIRNDAQSIKFSTLESLCDYFNIEIQDFLVSDKQRELSNRDKLNLIIHMANGVLKDLEAN
ncbi:helix-turn-helix domain-containing protein [Mammaliicoccus sciuri]|uniref:helix-turn-helix domain-containing protein n=1 Tax=Mammaliicoccus sciuri TaxID=1296 RepID=UPI001FB3F6A3|nr:helix-turn-helix transcriptional regulator [Mammaliicoccus sciuri]MCJ0969767.1 helix-turn-helix transcriptional regulator [Mammaliicoccus sciuri]